ncbi:hypothetical protein [uncultured Clostridium sp.]|uniref:hypothetical protein n=1 Tax=uncultured Clostridium sp. TaxID=59620 RepID=UPI002635025E|nr:hypothetical protein [uncultured Clostridium sp.]
MKKSKLLFLGVILIILNVGASTLDESCESSYRNIDMQNINVSLDENEELICEAKNDEEKEVYKKGKKVLEKAIKENEELKKYIKETVRKGERIEGISYTECYFQEEENLEEVNSKEKDAIDEGKSIYQGKKAKERKLTLISSLITKSEIVGTEAYALSSVAIWNSKDIEKRDIKDCISLCWPNTYKYNGVNVIKGYYDNRKEVNFNNEDKRDDSGIVWSFKRTLKDKENTYNPDNITAAVQIIPKGEKGETKIFSSEYIFDTEKLNIKLKKSSSKRYGGVKIIKGKTLKISSPIKIVVK